MEYRFAEGRYDRLADLVASLVRLPVDALVAGSPAMIRAATERAEALIVSGSGLFAMHQPQTAELALHYRLPTLAPFREFVEAGCLIAYGPNVTDLFRQAASTVDRLLRGAKAGDLPVEESAQFELAINLQTARALGLAVPPAVLHRAAVVVP